ncbi:MAG: nucleoside kinase [Cellulosilyticaceae bacterium]
MDSILQTVTYYDLAQEKKQCFKTPITVARVGNSLKELCSVVGPNEDTIEFLDLESKDGRRIYQRTVTFLMIVAAKKLFPNVTIMINHKISGGYFCEFNDKELCTTDNIELLEKKMNQLILEKHKIIKKTMPTDEAIALFEQEQMADKTEMLKYRRASTVNVYTLDGVSNYFYGYMMPTIDEIQNFKCIKYEHGFMLIFPNKANPCEIATFKPLPKLFEVFRESRGWARILNVDLVSALNNKIIDGQLENLIRVSEALHEKKIAEIAATISERKKTKVVLIAGPTSSGKTTFAERLCIQLKVSGLKPHVISIDDYFVNREDTPKDENGQYDFESINAIDTKLFNEHISKLIAGESVNIPKFNFKTGTRVDVENYMSLGKEDILVVEGIHGLNEELSYKIDKENKFKIYVSCLTQLNLDNYNRIPTTDTRLMRRMIRDHKHRGMSAEKTLSLWQSVRRGEEKNIFPFQEEADVMFNTVLIYELAVLKQKAEPLLFSVPRTSPYYGEAKRLLKFLEYFLSVDTDKIPWNSIIREFVGGSCFE